MKLLKIFVFYILTFNLFANAPIAEVIKMRGEATQLVPGENKAKNIVVGDKFLEDTSILTQAKSFLRIKFIDGSEINLGPESKIVISVMKADEPGVISLLKGRIRTEVVKSTSSKENKFFVKTRTAAMGVRGTEFQTIYNPDNKITSLLTYAGEVKMAKIDENQFHKLESLENNIQATSLDTSNEISSILKKNEAVSVFSGQNSIASDNLEKATLPVKISVNQLNILYKNKDYIEKNEKDLKKLAPSDEKNLINTIQPKEQIAPIEGFSNKTTGEFAPRAGGLIDLQSGLYIAPSASATYDTKNKLYLAQNIGDIDRDTGEYIAPTGLKLEAKTGFIIDGISNNPKLYAYKDDMNSKILNNMEVVNPNVLNEIPFNINEKFVHDELIVSMMFSGQELEVNKSLSSGSRFTLTTQKDKLKSSLEWKIASLGRWRTFLGSQFSNVNFNGSMNSGLTTESSKLFGIYLGNMFAYDRRFDLVSKVQLTQDHYLNQSSTTLNYSLKRIVTTKFYIGLHSHFFSEMKFPLLVDIFGTFSLRKRLNSIKVRESFGHQIYIGSSYNFSEKNYFNYGINLEEQFFKVIGDNGENRINRVESGLRFEYAYKF